MLNAPRKFALCAHMSINLKLLWLLWMRMMLHLRMNRTFVSCVQWCFPCGSLICRVFTLILVGNSPPCVFSDFPLPVATFLWWGTSKLVLEDRVFTPRISVKPNFPSLMLCHTMSYRTGSGYLAHSQHEGSKSMDLCIKDDNKGSVIEYI